MRKILMVVVAIAGLSGFAVNALADCLGEHAPVKQSVMNETGQTQKPAKPGS